MVFTAVGLALMVPNWIAVLGLIALVAAVQLQVRVVEEPYLSTVHTDAYGAYSTRTGRSSPASASERPDRQRAELSGRGSRQGGAAPFAFRLRPCP